MKKDMAKIKSKKIRTENKKIKMKKKKKIKEEIRPK